MSTPDSPQPAWQEPAEPRRLPSPRLLAVVAGLLFVLAYVAAAAAAGDRVPRGTSVGGVAVGGLTHDAARARLTAALAERADAPLTLTAGSRSARLTPEQAGLTPDVERSLDGLTGFTLAPTALWAHLAGGSARPLAVTTDRAALTAALQKTRDALDVAAVDGALTLPKGKVTERRAVAGQRVDVERTADAVLAAWPRSQTVAAVTEALAPRISAAEVARVRRDYLDEAMSAPVTVRAGTASFTLTPASYAPALSVQAKGASLEVVRDDARLREIVTAAATKAGVVRPAKDAVVTFQGEKPTVTPSQDGAALDAKALPGEVWPALTADGRTATLTTRVVQPKLTTATAKATLPRERISTFTTYYGAPSARTHNLELAASVLDGTYVPPGGTFSLNAVLGQRTPEKGYRSAPVIMNGRLTNDYGGGISQVSTTTFNAAFFSGMKFLAYTPHAFYISRYPEGREATISWPDVDQRWVNTTDGGVLIKASAGGQKITVSFYGTKKWDIEASKGPRRNVVSPRTIRDDSPGCVPQAPTPGFDVTVTRTFRQGGSTVRTESFSTHYIPEDDVTCTHPDAG